MAFRVEMSMGCFCEIIFKFCNNQYVGVINMTSYRDLMEDDYTYTSKETYSPKEEVEMKKPPKTKRESLSCSTNKNFG